MDHERRELLMEQRRSDVFKAKWAEKERGDRQVRFHTIRVAQPPNTMKLIGSKYPDATIIGFLRTLSCTVCFNSW